MKTKCIITTYACAQKSSRHQVFQSIFFEEICKTEYPLISTLWIGKRLTWFKCLNPKYFKIHLDYNLHNVSQNSPLYNYQHSIRRINFVLSMIMLKPSKRIFPMPTFFPFQSISLISAQKSSRIHLHLGGKKTNLAWHSWQPSYICLFLFWKKVFLLR
jgi:hypothetical protein